MKKIRFSKEELKQYENLNPFGGGWMIVVFMLLWAVASYYATKNGRL